MAAGPPPFTDFSESIAIVGRGRVGGGLGLAWSAAGIPVSLLARAPGDSSLPLTTIAGESAWAPAVRAAAVVVVAVPDDAITDAARVLAGLGAVSARHTVLHTAGLPDREALNPLQASGAALGSLHPLMAVPRPESAPALLRGAVAGIEGDPRAVDAARRLAEVIGMEPVEIPSSAKAAYHAAAAMVSNFTVAVYGAAVRLAEQGGVESAVAERIYLPLLRGTVENVAAMGATRALTGAIRRGDERTVARHLAAVGTGDLRRLYLELGWATLALAREAGLDQASAERIARVLAENRAQTQR